MYNLLAHVTRECNPKLWSIIYHPWDHPENDEMCVQIGEHLNPHSVACGENPNESVSRLVVIGLISLIALNE